MRGRIKNQNSGQITGGQAMEKIPNSNNSLEWLYHKSKSKPSVCCLFDAAAKCKKTPLDFDNQKISSVFASKLKDKECFFFVAEMRVKMLFDEIRLVGTK